MSAPRPGSYLVLYALVLNRVKYELEVQKKGINMRHTEYDIRELSKVIVDSGIRRFLILTLLLASMQISKADIVAHPDTEAEVRTVYERVATVMGTRPAPTLLVVDDPHVIGAGFNSKTLTITVNPALISASQKHFGDRWDDAVALCLGHELAHFKYNHDWNHTYGIVAAPLERKIKEANALAFRENRKRIEDQADYEGGFWAYVAGYDTLDIAPEVVDMLYTDLGATESRDYSPKEERKDTLVEHLKELSLNAPMADAALLLLLADEPGLAGICFDRLSTEFPCRAMLVNAGASLMHSGIQSQADLKFGYPLLFDSESRMPRPSLRDTGKGEPVSRGVDGAMALKRAHELLGKANNDFPDDPIILLNLACLRHIEGQRDQAHLFISKALDLAQGNGLIAAAAQMINGIVLASKEDDADAESAFLAASSEFPELAKTNLHALLPDKYPAPAESSSQDEPAQCDLRIANMTPSELPAQAISDEWKDAHKSELITAWGTVEVCFEGSETWDAYVLQFTGNSMQVRASFLKTRPEYDKTICDELPVRIGTTRTAALKALGPPQKEAASNDIQSLLFPREKLIVDLTSGQALVKGWTLYVVEE